MIAVISPTDFTQGQFAFKTKRNSGSYKTHQAPTEKIVPFSETLRKGMSLAFKFTEKGPCMQKFVYKRLLTKAEKGKVYRIKFNGTGKRIFKWELVGLKSGIYP